jgi:hypothetical protein
MKCKHCGGDIKQSGDVWVSDLSLEDKLYVMKWNGFNKDHYRYFSMFCGFNDDGKPHAPDEVEAVKELLYEYRSGKNRPQRQRNNTDTLHRRR